MAFHDSLNGVMRSAEKRGRAESSPVSLFASMYGSSTPPEMEDGAVMNEGQKSMRYPCAIRSRTPSVLFS